MHPPPPTKSDEDLAREYLAGDADAFRQLVDRYAGTLCRFAQRFVRDAQSAEDLAQETFIRIYSHLPKTDLTRPLKPWIYHICANLCRNAVAKHGFVPFSALESDDEEGDPLLDRIESKDIQPHEEAVRTDTIEEVRTAVAALPEKYRMVVELYYYEQLSYEEIADILSLPLNTVRTHLHRAKSQLENACRHLL